MLLLASLLLAEPGGADMALRVQSPFPPFGLFTSALPREWCMPSVAAEFISTTSSSQAFTDPLVYCVKHGFQNEAWSINKVIGIHEAS